MLQMDLDGFFWSVCARKVIVTGKIYVMYRLHLTFRNTIEKMYSRRNWSDREVQLEMLRSIMDNGPFSIEPHVEEVLSVNYIGNVIIDSSQKCYYWFNQETDHRFTEGMWSTLWKMNEIIGLHRKFDYWSNLWSMPKPHPNISFHVSSDIIAINNIYNHETHDRMEDKQINDLFTRCSFGCFHFSLVSIPALFTRHLM